jgi:hypothetical protein
MGASPREGFALNFQYPQFAGWLLRRRSSAFVITICGIFFGACNALRHFCESPSRDRGKRKKAQRSGIKL